MAFTLPWLLALGCATPESDSGEDSAPNLPNGELAPGCGEAAATVEVGTGEDTFTPLADGDPLTMVHGPQGGWHLLASARVTDTRSVVAITYTAATAAGVQVVWNRYVVDLVPEAGCTGVYAGMYGYLDVHALEDGEADTPPELLAGEELTLTLTVEDADGRVAVGEKRVVAEPDPVDVKG